MFYCPVKNSSLTMRPLEPFRRWHFLGRNFFTWSTSVDFYIHNNTTYIQRKHHDLPVWHHVTWCWWQAEQVHMPGCETLKSSNSFRYKISQLKLKLVDRSFTMAVPRREILLRPIFTHSCPIFFAILAKIECSICGTLGKNGLFTQFNSDTLSYNSVVCRHIKRNIF